MLSGTAPGSIFGILIVAAVNARSLRHWIKIGRSGADFSKVDMPLKPAYRQTVQINISRAVRVHSCHAFLKPAAKPTPFPDDVGFKNPCRVGEGQLVVRGWRFRHANFWSRLRIVLILFRIEILVKPLVVSRIVLPEIQPIKRIG